VVLSARTRADHHQPDGSARQCRRVRARPRPPRGGTISWRVEAGPWPVGQTRWPGVADSCGLAACVAGLCSSGQNRVAAIAQDLGSACWICRLRSGSSGSASCRSGVIGPGTKRLAASCTRWWPTYRGHHWHGADRSGRSVGSPRLLPGCWRAVTNRAICGLLSPDTSVCSRADTSRRPEARSSIACSRP
jgi:hypothetical protein